MSTFGFLKVEFLECFDGVCCADNSVSVSRVDQDLDAGLVKVW
jgi:hypothetical protein